MDYRQPPDRWTIFNFMIDGLSTPGSMDYRQPWSMDYRQPQGRWTVVSLLIDGLSMLGSMDYRQPQGRWIIVNLIIDGLSSTPGSMDYLPVAFKPFVNHTPIKAISQFISCR